MVPSAGRVASMYDGSIPFAADNGCFQSLDAPAFLRMLAFLTDCESKPLFVVSPDVVGDWRETMRKFSVWGPVIRELGLPVALVGQDGLPVDSVPWKDIDAYFIGGTDKWKLTNDSRNLVHKARDREKHVHMGRVNSCQRIHTATKWGCDTVDGTSFTWFADTLIPKAVKWIDSAMGDSLYATSDR